MAWLQSSKRGARDSQPRQSLWINSLDINAAVCALGASVAIRSQRHLKAPVPLCCAHLRSQGSTP